MNKYEMIYILESALSDEAKDQIIEKIDATITKNGGVIENVDVWGKRRLAYAINYETEGYYVLVNFEADSKVPAELDRVFNITTGVLRSMIIKK